MKISQKGLDLIKEYEQGPEGGPALEAYLCPARAWTLGWGHTKGVRFGQIATEEQCELFLLSDVLDAEKAVEDLVEVPLTQYQFDALVCLVYNIGRGRPLGHKAGARGFHGSTLLQLLNAGNYLGAADQFTRWDKAKGTKGLTRLKGLTRRRADERNLFLTGSY